MYRCVLVFFLNYKSSIQLSLRDWLRLVSSSRPHSWWYYHSSPLPALLTRWKWDFKVEGKAFRPARVHFGGYFKCVGPRWEHPVLLRQAVTATETEFSSVWSFMRKTHVVSCIHASVRDRKLASFFFFFLINCIIRNAESSVIIMKSNNFQSARNGSFACAESAGFTNIRRVMNVSPRKTRRLRLRILKYLQHLSFKKKNTNKTNTTQIMNIFHVFIYSVI